MNVIEPAADIFEKGFDWRSMRGWRRHGAGFVDLIRIIGGGVCHYAASSAARPIHFDPQKVRQTTRRKNAQRLVARKIATPANHLLALDRHRAAVNTNPGSDAAGVVS